MKSRVKKIQSVLLSFCLIFLAAHAVAADTGNIGVKVIIGFNGMCRAGTWTPVSVVLENQGPGIDSGLLRLGITQGNEFRRDILHTDYSQEIHLPSGAKKIYRFTVLIRTGLHPLVLSLEQDGQLLFSIQKELQGRVTDQPVILTLLDRTGEEPPTLLPNGFRTAAARAEYLPIHWQGYQAVSRIILSPALLPRLSHSQRFALDTWVETGGCLVVTGSVNTAIFTGPAVKRLLGVVPTGLATITRIPALLDFCGVPDTPLPAAGNELWVNRVHMPGATPLVSQEGLGLVWSLPRKDGRIIFAAMDMAGLDGWEGLERFWQTLLALGPAPLPGFDAPPFDAPGRDGWVAECLMQNSFRLFPSAPLAGALLGIYVLLAAMCLKKPNPKPRVLAGLAAVVTAACGIAGGLYLVLPDFGADLSITRVYGSRAFLREDTYHGFYTSRAVHRKIDLGPAGQTAELLFPPSLDMADRLAGEFRETDGHTALHLDFRRYSVNHVKTVRPAPSGFSTSSAGAAGVILHNRSGRDIRNAVVYSRGRVFFLGDLPGDQSVELRTGPGISLSPELTAGERARLETFFTRDIQGRAEIFRPLFSQTMEAVHQAWQAGAGVTLLAGWGGHSTGDGWVLWQIRTDTAPLGEDTG